MNFKSEYNEYVVGYVVTCDQAEGGVNFQFERFSPTNHPQPAIVLTWGCTGDDTHKNFTQEQLDEALDYVNNLTEAKALKKMLWEIEYNDVSKEALWQLHAEQGYLTVSNIEQVYSDMTKVWTILDNGQLDSELVFNTKEEAEAELEAWGENGYLAKVILIDKAEFDAIETISYFSNGEIKVDILKALYSNECSLQKDYVIDQLSTITISDLTTDLAQNYFWRLIGSELCVYKTLAFNCSDEPSFNEIKRITFDEYVIQETNALLQQVFDKKVDVSVLLKD